MHSTTGIARNAITAGLGIALAMGSIALTPAAALAENGSITITQQHNEGATYDAYMLFQADIDANDKATHVAWASNSMQTNVLDFLDDNGYAQWLSANHPGDGQRELPQNAAQYIAFMISGSEEDTIAATTPRTTMGLSFANELAQALARNDTSPKQIATSGKAFTQPEGYWLFVSTDATTEASGEAGTAPIWVPLGGSTKIINEKTSVPSIDKQVKEDSTGTWGKVADANVGQDLDYLLTAKLPSNFGAFDTYHLKFTDTLSSGLEVAIPQGRTIRDAVSVKVGGKDAAVDTSNLLVSYEGNVLTVEFVDLKSDHWKSLAAAGNAEVTVEYKAHITSAGALGTAGNANTVSLTYTDDPVSTKDGTITPGPTTKAFAYQVRLLKVDEQTNEPLAGARFTVQVASGNSDSGSAGQYVQADGSLSSQATTFTTGPDGTLLIPGIDEGTYTITEIEPPQGYELIDDNITLVVTSSLVGDDLTLSELTATSSGGDAEDGNAASKTEVTSIDTATGTINLNVTNDRWLLMPITGQEGLPGAVAMGVALASTAGAGLWWRRGRH